MNTKSLKMNPSEEIVYLRKCFAGSFEAWQNDFENNNRFGGQLIERTGEPSDILFTEVECPLEADCIHLGRKIFKRLDHIYNMYITKHEPKSISDDYLFNALQATKLDWSKGRLHNIDSLLEAKTALIDDKSTPKTLQNKFIDKMIGDCFFVLENSLN